MLPPGSITNAAGVPPDSVNRGHSGEQRGLEVEHLCAGLKDERGEPLAGDTPVGVANR